ncbi:tyrosine-type recombinase/integrase [Albidovulum sediminis]|uniref:Site-specific integrase n=1 Tax=Albidovulum sediminis TaxID=3066345 RepID=A0ABT2NJ30_9RHOB|nr:site-specific integrase [Defluviimonas sediminis]MCT8327944.1 site-specific integrase [Defluviimonas sediminis]
MRLTDILIKSLKVPATGQKTHFDDALPGFGVRVSQGGTKSFVVMFGTRRRLKTIGRYPDLSLAEARREAKRVQVDAATAIAALPRDEPVPFDTARDRFLADSKLRHKERTHTDYDRLLCRHFSFSKDMDTLTRADIVTAVEKLAATPSEQQHAFVAVRAMMNWCVKRGILDHSPVPALTFRSVTRSNVLSDPDLKAVYNRAVATGYPYGSIVQLLILSGQRRGEIAALRRSWIEGDLIVFPAGFTKNKREHRCPLSPLAQRLIEALPEIGDMLFPARGVPDHPFNGWGKSKERFDKPLEVAAYTLHDLRRTFSSNLARLGTPIHVTEKLLNHVSGTVSGVAAIYNRYSYLDEMRAALMLHDEYLAKLTAD